MPTWAELQQEWGSLITELKAWRARQDEEFAKYGQPLAATRASLDKVLVDVDLLQKAISDLQVRMDRPVYDGGPGDRKSALSPEQQHYKEAFWEWSRWGTKSPLLKMDTLIPERKVLTAGDDTGGGYLAEPEFVREIIKGVIEFSDFRRYARVRTTSNRSVKIRRRTGTFAAVWTAESGTRSETTGLAYGMEEVPNHEVYGLVDVSHEDLEDSMFDLENELQMEFAEQFAVADNAAFITGSGVGRPEGVLTATGVSSVNSGDANLLTFNAFYDAYYNIATAHSNMGTWLMNRLTLRDARKLTDGQGQYLWEPITQAGQPTTLLGRPVAEAPEMPNVAAAATPVVFGNFMRGYLIVERLMMTIQRDPYTQQTSGAVRFLARRRVGGQVVLAEAMTKILISA